MNFYPLWYFCLKNFLDLNGYPIGLGIQNYLFINCTSTAPCLKHFMIYLLNFVMLIFMVFVFICWCAEFYNKLLYDLI